MTYRVPEGLLLTHHSDSGEISIHFVLLLLPDVPTNNECRINKKCQQKALCEVMGHPVKLLYSFLWIGDWREPFFLQLLDSLLVLPQVKFGAHEDDGHVGAVVPHLRIPLGTHVLEGGGVHQ